MSSITDDHSDSADITYCSVCKTKCLAMLFLCDSKQKRKFNLVHNKLSVLPEKDIEIFRKILDTRGPETPFEQSYADRQRLHQLSQKASPLHRDIILTWAAKYNKDDEYVKDEHQSVSYDKYSITEQGMEAFIETAGKLEYNKHHAQPDFYTNDNISIVRKLMDKQKECTPFDQVRQQRLYLNKLLTGNIGILLLHADIITDLYNKVQQLKQGQARAIQKPTDDE